MASSTLSAILDHPLVLRMSSSATASVPLFVSASVAIAVFVSVALARRSRGRTLKNIRGPEPKSYWLGNLGDIRYQSEVGTVEFPWMREYGGAWKVTGCMGQERLMIADAKAMQYVLQTSGYRFPKSHEVQAASRQLLGLGIATIGADQHPRHRKIMNPAFTAPQLKSFLSLFLRHTNKLVQKWKDEISGAATEDPLINVHRWLSRLTLDVIGEAGFGFDFMALDDGKNPLSGVYDNLFIDSTLYPHKWDVVFKSFWQFVPLSVLWFLRYIPSREYRRFRNYQDHMRAFAHDFLGKSEGKSAAEGKDIMSVLIRADQAEEPRLKLSKMEIYDQISTLILAGHDTTAISTSWWLYAIAKHPEWQRRAREELRAVRANVAARGDTEFSLADLESMTVLHATMKESMRLDPIVWQLIREAGQDDVIPLAHPITTVTGERVTAIPVKKGQLVDISIASYNRNPEVWGEDADEWRPERFMSTEKHMTNVGVYANLLNFSAGIRGCIGWRFSIIEMQAIAATLLENFEFSLPEQTDKTKIYRAPSGLMMPIAMGYGAWMGLHVKSIN